MVRIGYEMLSVVSRTVHKNFQLTTLKSETRNNHELLCRCGLSASFTKRQDPLAECQFHCGNQEENAEKCEYKLTLKPINFINTVPSLFVYELKETGEVFKSFHVNPRSALLEFYGLVPVLTQTLKDGALFADEVTMQEHREHLQTLELLDIFLLVLNTVNEQVITNLEQSSLWSERILKYFYKTCDQLRSNEQFIACKEKYTLDNIMNSLLEFVNCQV